MDCSLPGSSMGSGQTRTLEWVTMPSSKGSSWPRGWTYRTAWWATVHGVAKSQTQLSDFIHSLWHCRQILWFKSSFIAFNIYSHTKRQTHHIIIWGEKKICNRGSYMKKPKCRTGYILYYLLVFKKGSGKRLSMEENKSLYLSLYLLVYAWENSRTTPKRPKTEVTYKEME